MKTILVSAGNPYEVLIGRGILSQAGELTRQISSAQKAVIVTDDTVEGLYAAQAVRSLTDSGFEVSLFSFPHGEAQKSHRTLIQLYDFLCDHQVTRKDLIVALGGGVTGDLAGFAAATYLRGMDFVQIPTTLLAQIDSSVGGKTGVDIPGGKNLVGAFWQPRLVLCDPDVLSTLSEEIFADGMAEAIKYGAIKDASLFEMIESGEYREQLEELIARCIQIKADVVAQDEFDTGERMLLNFGHTLGHAIEQHYHYETYTHGSAVAIGMVRITQCAQQAGLSPQGLAQRIAKVCRLCGLPTRDEITNDALVKGCAHDKKRMKNTLNLILLDEIGRSKIVPMQLAKFTAFVKGEAR